MKLIKIRNHNNEQRKSENGTDRIMVDVFHYVSLLSHSIVLT